ncbi:TonB-dependent receptor [Shewanella sedimentimangrovi]|uniref:TonB-dependent receptor n=1 Tax=Shewanella sedimentimangrovi TaxID=2814293 RepID=A0ABX7R199_9GAMM|nr:TonB-dependent receptor [Shewanella sedimentimangrovi]QSX36868.1 TonB-dependent receptor [Shewanella sedimentimangrovi]
MRFSLSPLSLGILPLLCAAAQAQTMDEVLEVRGQRPLNSLSSSPKDKVQADLGALLRDMAGAGLNSNGPLSGIAQYRGLFGDRVHQDIDGHSHAGAGPNAMDTPLSYGSGILTEALELERGIADIARGTDTLGGSLHLVESQARANEYSAGLRGQYQANGAQSRLGAKANLGSEQQALLLFADRQQGHTVPQSGAGHRLLPGIYQQTQFGAKYRLFLNDEDYLGLDARHLETDNSATPALPMDIDYIRSDRVHTDGSHALGDARLKWQLGYGNGRHGMDNDSLRLRMPTMAARYNQADTEDWQASIKLSDGDWQFGLDISQARHNSVISDPNNPMLRVDNFNDVRDDSYSLFGQWQSLLADWQWQLGARVKHYRFDADAVNHSMAAMKPAIKTLMDRFNQADRSGSDTGLDLVLQGRRALSEDLAAVVGLARKQANASYQQRFLWVPMQSTGGLADGRTYVGTLDLRLETAWQLELGLDLQQQQWLLSPRLFVQRIDNYIQGLPTADPALLMAGDAHTLVFSNTDALLYGMDLQGELRLTEHWQLMLAAAYIHGERRDEDGDLYRIAAPNANLGLVYNSGNWFAGIHGRAVAAQDKVSAVQLEQATPGYFTLDIKAGWQGNNWRVSAGVDNLFDLEYADHLGGYNRVAGGDVPVGERLPQPGLNAWLMADYRL